MRLFIGIVGLGLGLSASCSSYNMEQCASDCACQRVACCCGTGCDKTGATVNYNACVPANSPYEQWTGCPASCPASAGLVRTITACVAPTPAVAPTASSSDPSIPFGATFPMIGTQELAKQTWQKNVYMGTSLQFNKGAFWGYTDSYYVPSYGNSGDNGNNPPTDDNGNLVPTPAPTPQDATGRPCFAYSNPCPAGYYCKLNAGYNVQQKGTCQREAADTWNGGAGKFTDSSYYSGLAHPPLALDPDHNGVSAPPGYGYGNNYGSGGAYGSYGGSFGGSYGSGSGYGSGYGSNNYAPGGVGAQSCAPLASGAPVCGYKSFSGTCFCDSDCGTKGDCCPDYAQFCGVLSSSYTGGPLNTPSNNNMGPSNPQAYSNPATTSANNGQCDPVGQCAGLCGTSNSAIGVNGKPCYCDSQCALSGDCCCSASQCNASG